MAIEHYSSLASNRNYKIHNASERACARSLPDMYTCGRLPARSTKTTSTNKINLYLQWRINETNQKL